MRCACAQPQAVRNVDTAAEDVALIAFTSGTTGKPKGTMHFHRDVMAMCDAFPRSCLLLGEGRHLLRHAAARLHLRPGRHAAPSRCASARPPCWWRGSRRRRCSRPSSATKATICFTAPTMYRAMAGLAKDYDLRVAEEMRLGGRGAAGCDAAAVQAGERHRDHRRHRRHRDDPHLHLAHARARAPRRHRLRHPRLPRPRCSTRTATRASRAWSGGSR